MSKRFRRHAEQIVSDFKGFLSEEARQAVGEENFDELSMMIESALSASVMDALEKAADQVDQVGASIRHSAEHFDA
ncbi:MAG TPA: phosphatase [Chromatiales bacterium]|nr:phosphatase [Chromatiales bacterium]